MRTLIILATVAAAAFTPAAASAQRYGYNHEVRREVQECRREIADARRDSRRDWRHDRRDWRDDRGHYGWRDRNYGSRW